ncbi:hypothetical protein PsSCT_09970 [Pseudomonas sp. SCT]
MAIALIQNQGSSLAFELGGKRTSLLAHRTPLDGEDFRLNRCPGSVDHYTTVWDQMFGTFYDSAGKLGEAEVGLHEKDYPRNYFGQFIDPVHPTSAYPAGHNSSEQDEIRNT